MPEASDFITNPETGEVVGGTTEPEPIISQEQRQALFRLAKEHMGADANAILKDMVKQYGYESTNGMPVSVYNKVVGEIMRLAQERKKERAVEANEEARDNGQDQPAE